jgi:anti-sigma regulatory factor (Ser/Thr protein kinase)
VTSRRPDSATGGGAFGDTVAPGPGRALGRGGFWITFAVGWVAYLGLLSVPVYLEGQPASPVLLMTAGPALLAILLAWRRRSLANPDRPLLRTAGLLAGVGVVYAVSSALLSLFLMWLAPSSPSLLWEEGTMKTLVSLTFYSIILYAILAGFLLWSESLERIQESRAMAAREAVLRAEAEAKALRAQFNPHFVFNTLHSLMLLVREDPGTAERAIEDVASLIRYASTLERRGQDTVALGQELEMARRYLALEALRLEERLGVAWEVDPELEGMAVPAFALQTLLENAIKHGLSPKPEGGRIRVAARRGEGRMILRVEDDGMGADPRQVAATEGSGLRLLERRLAGLYGDAASLSWRTAPGEGFDVELRWPATPAGAWEGSGSPPGGGRRPPSGVSGAGG